MYGFPNCICLFHVVSLSVCSFCVHWLLLVHSQYLLDLVLGLTPVSSRETDRISLIIWRQPQLLMLRKIWCHLSIPWQHGGEGNQLSHVETAFIIHQWHYMLEDLHQLNRNGLHQFLLPPVLFIAWVRWSQVLLAWHLPVVYSLLEQDTIKTEAG